VLILLAVITLIRSEMRQQKPNDPHGEGIPKREAALL